MCKFYANQEECPFEHKNGECDMIHCKKVRVVYNAVGRMVEIGE